MSTSTSTNLDNTTCAVAFIPPLNPDRVALIAQSGGKIVPLDPIGAAIYGIDLRQERPPEATMQALEAEMANRGFVVFKGQQGLTPDELIEATKWWGAREMHSTHGVHPATPGRNRHIFRASNDNEHGILGVGPQWHNDGSFEAAPFSHVGYHRHARAEKGEPKLPSLCHCGPAENAVLVVVGGATILAVAPGGTPCVECISRAPHHLVASISSSRQTLLALEDDEPAIGHFRFEGLHGGLGRPLLAQINAVDCCANRSRGTIFLRSEQSERYIGIEGRNERHRTSCIIQICRSTSTHRGGLCD